MLRWNTPAGRTATLDGTAGKGAWHSAGMASRLLPFGISKSLSGTRRGREDSWEPGHMGSGGWLPGRGS